MMHNVSYRVSILFPSWPFNKPSQQCSNLDLSSPPLSFDILTASTTNSASLVNSAWSFLFFLCPLWLFPNQCSVPFITIVTSLNTLHKSLLLLSPFFSLDRWLCVLLYRQVKRIPVGILSTSFPFPSTPASSNLSTPMELGEFLLTFWPIPLT